MEFKNEKYVLVKDQNGPPGIENTISSTYQKIFTQALSRRLQEMKLPAPFNSLEELGKYLRKDMWILTGDFPLAVVTNSGSEQKTISLLGYKRELYSLVNYPWVNNLVIDNRYCVSTALATETVFYQNTNIHYMMVEENEFPVLYYNKVCNLDLCTITWDGNTWSVAPGVKIEDLIDRKMKVNLNIVKNKTFQGNFKHIVRYQNLGFKITNLEELKQAYNTPSVLSEINLTHFWKGVLRYFPSWIPTFRDQQLAMPVLKGTKIKFMDEQFRKYFEDVLKDVPKEYIEVPEPKVEKPVEVVQTPIQVDQKSFFQELKDELVSFRKAYEAGQRVEEKDTKPEIKTSCTALQARNHLPQFLYDNIIFTVRHTEGYTCTCTIPSQIMTTADVDKICVALRSYGFSVNLIRDSTVE